MSLPPERTGVTPWLRRNQPMGPTNSACLVKMCICRPSSGVSQPTSSGGWALEMWLATTISGPSRGISPSSSTLTRAAARSTSRQIAAATRVTNGTPLWRARSVIDRARPFSAADDLDHPGNGLFEAAAGGIEHLGPVGDAQRAGGPGAVDPVAPAQLVLDVRNRARGRRHAPILRPPPRPLGDGHLEVQLEVGVEQH